MKNAIYFLPHCNMANSTMGHQQDKNYQPIDQFYMVQIKDIYQNYYRMHRTRLHFKKEKYLSIPPVHHGRSLKISSSKKLNYVENGASKGDQERSWVGSRRWRRDDNGLAPPWEGGVQFKEPWGGWLYSPRRWERGLCFLPTLEGSLFLSGRFAH